jgi:hypothetical protein
MTVQLRSPLKMASPIFFIHIPKTGGNTFASVLRRNAPSSDLLLPSALKEKNEPKLDAQLRAVAERPERARSIHGHVPLSYRDFLPDNLRLATLLRDPVRRQYSHYQWIFGRRLAAGKGPSVAEAFARGRLIDNLQTRMLCGLKEPLTRPADDEMFRAARAELDRFTFVGLVEWFPESMLLAQERLRLRHIAYCQRNVRGTSHAPEELDALRDHNRLDLELYDQARTLLAPEFERLRSRAAGLARADEVMTHRRPVADPVVVGYVADFCWSSVAARVQRGWALVLR